MDCGSGLFSAGIALPFIGDAFLQRGRIACNAEPCNTYGNSVRLSVRHTLVPYPDE